MPRRVAHFPGQVYIPQQCIDGQVFLNDKYELIHRLDE